MNNPKSEVLFHLRRNISDVTKSRIQSSTKVVNASRTSEPKKQLVRHPEMCVSTTICKNDTPPESDVKCEHPSKSSPSEEFYKTDLSAPNLNSALRIVKEINLTKTMSTSSSQAMKLVDEGKVLQKVNFPYEEHLYHDLVALNVSHTVRSAPGGSARSSNKYLVRGRDKEPALSQFFTPSFSNEYTTSREPPVHVFGSLSTDCASIYQRMCSWHIRE